MSYTEKISKAKAKLLVDYPFFGALASKVEIVQNDDIEAFKSQESKLQYSALFIADASIEELEFVLANSAMHASLGHDNRKNKRSGWLWQLATDYAINDMLVESGLKRPYQAHYNKRYEGLYAEEIYAQLKDDLLREDDGLEYEAEDLDDVNSEDNRLEESRLDSSFDTNETSTQQILNDQLFEEFALSEIQKEKEDARFPDAIKRFFDLSYASKINWTEELYEAINKYARDDFVMIPPNKKYLHLGIYLPSPTSETFRLVIGIDSSGSIDDALLSEFLSEVNYLMLSISKYEIDLIVCDDKVRSHTTFYTGDTLDVELKGGSGTDFRPLFRYVDTHLPHTHLLLYFSDLAGTFPKDEPHYDVKWVTKSEDDTPFGSSIVL